MIEVQPGLTSPFSIRGSRDYPHTRAGIPRDVKTERAHGHEGAGGAVFERAQTDGIGDVDDVFRFD